MNTQPIEPHWKTSIYVYAIVPTRPGTDEAIGSDPASAQLRTIAAGPFAAVIGDDPNVEGRSRSREDLAPKLLAHQKIIEQIMQAAPVLPVKFGTIVPDEASVHAILERGSASFGAAFDRLAGCAQVEILVKWDVEAVFAEIAKEEAIAGLKKKWELNVGPSDEALRVVLGGLVKQSLDRRRAALAATLSEALRAGAVDAIAYPATADHIILHLALLMKADEMAALDRRLEALDGAHGGRLAFRCVGPLAPYSFATVEIEVVEATALAQAMRQLDVGPTASAAEIRAAYRRAAKSVHPDATGADASMAALTEAHRILSLNAKADGRPRDAEEVRSACDPHGAGRSVIISVRRQELAFNVAA